MLLTSVIIILREVLEAALLLSILLAMTRFMALGYRWLAVSLCLGLIGAVLYGQQLPSISNAFDGVGQEVCNAAAQLAIYALLLVIGVLFIRHYYGFRRPHRPLLVTMCLAIALAIMREGSEIFIYLSGTRHLPDSATSIAIGSLIGTGIGFSIGALFYYLLLSFDRGRSLLLGCILLTLVGASMCLQATQLLIQADWLPSSAPLWDSSALLPEGSVIGQLLYALIGYEATPSPLQVSLYIGSLLLMSLALLGAYTLTHRRESSL